MQSEAGFQGEIEFVEKILPDQDFGDFQGLPNITLIHELAGEFSNSLELMPYQKVGDTKRLLISVYLETSNVSGKVIAVLARDPYPNSWQDLIQIMEIARERLSILDNQPGPFPAESIATARNAIASLDNKIRQHIAKQGNW